MSETLILCGVPSCGRPGYWEGVCSMHHWEAHHAYAAGVLREIQRDLQIEDVLPSEPATPTGKLKIHMVPLAWQPHGGTPYGRAVLKRMVERVGLCEAGNRNETLNRASYVIGGYVAGGELDRATVADALIQAACIAGLPWHEAARTVLSGLKKGMAKPITAPS